jgi:ribosome-binding factor A
MAEALREEITALVEGELGDPRIGLVSVSEVQLAADGRTARVFISAAGSDSDAEQSLLGLKAAGGYIRHELVSRLGIRQAPEIVFVLDDSQEHGGRVDELLQRIQKRKRQA